jgi:hypothetical protein
MLKINADKETVEKALAKLNEVLNKTKNKKQLKNK